MLYLLKYQMKKFSDLFKCNDGYCGRFGLDMSTVRLLDIFSMRSALIRALFGTSFRDRVLVIYKKIFFVSSIKY